MGGIWRGGGYKICWGDSPGGIFSGGGMSKFSAGGRDSPHPPSKENPGMYDLLVNTRCLRVKNPCFKDHITATLSAMPNYKMKLCLPFTIEVIFHFHLGVIRL